MSVHISINGDGETPVAPNVQPRAASAQSRASHFTGRPLSAGDLRRAFIAPPPEVLRRSPLYTSLPEAKLHEDSGSILERLRATQQHRQRTAVPVRQIREEVSAALKQTSCAPTPAAASLAGAFRPASAASRPRSGLSRASNAATSAVVMRHRAPAWDSTSIPVASSPLGQRGNRTLLTPTKKPNTLESCPPPPAMGTATTNELFCATQFMVKQQQDVVAFETARKHHQEAVAAERERRWHDMRAAREDDERHRRVAGATRRQLQRAVQIAAEQVLEQKRQERAMLQHVERTQRSDVERAQRRERHHLAYSLWFGTQELHFAERRDAILDSEFAARLYALSDSIGDMESRARGFYVRLYTVTRTQVLSLEKVERVSLQRYVTARAQWKAMLDAQLNAFLAHERKLRQKVFDDEAFAFIEIDSAKQALILEQTRALRRIEELRAAAVREFELQQHNERLEFDREETDARMHHRNDEVTVRAIIRNDFVDEKKAASERAKKRVQRERSEWEAECARQQRPTVDEENEARREIDHLWNREITTMLQGQRQELEEVMVPVILFAHAPQIPPPVPTQTPQLQPAGSFTRIARHPTHDSMHTAAKRKRPGTERADAGQRGGAEGRDSVQRDLLQPRASRRAVSLRGLPQKRALRVRVECHCRRHGICAHIERTVLRRRCRTAGRTRG
jgi:hypothetical protein